jgi:hypothetical protein
MGKIKGQEIKLYICYITNSYERAIKNCT